MAMTGMRRMTTALGLVGRPPPQRILPGRREETVELAHWLFGVAAGAVFSALVRPRARSRWAGPAYGVAIWAGFETFVAPLLERDGPRERSLTSRMAVAADHVLYGAIVAGDRAP